MDVCIREECRSLGAVQLGELGFMEIGLAGKKESNRLAGG